jgi:5-methylcytosine-specific restriction endonuclease McrA
VAKGHVQRQYDRRALTFNQKARAHGVRGFVTPEELAALPLACHYCGVELDHLNSDFDHVIPFARGGTNTIDNIVRACGPCNGAKFTKTPEEHEAYQKATWACMVCGKDFRPRHSDWRNGNGKVCSRRCAGKRRWVNA